MRSRKLMLCGVAAAVMGVFATVNATTNSANTGADIRSSDQSVSFGAPAQPTVMPSSGAAMCGSATSSDQSANCISASSASGSTLAATDRNGTRWGNASLGG
jgi:hypothetical protein